ncbi:hypothetical protein J6590_011967 [Homalodisca vitripennis]|nr:hypothetical protein J6590_011967 [Homalodisca vitripennis]
MYFIVLPRSAPYSSLPALPRNVAKCMRDAIGGQHACALSSELSARLLRVRKTRMSALLISIERRVVSRVRSENWIRSITAFAFRTSKKRRINIRDGRPSLGVFPPIIITESLPSENQLTDDNCVMI